jgi:uncharacterized SAM-binding protein YcdF (DUF218 family)
MQISPLNPEVRRRGLFADITLRWLAAIFAVFVLTMTLVIFTPIVALWARAYSGPMNRPSGDILILLAAADDYQGEISDSSYWRANFALTVWRTGTFKKFVISGGAGPGIVNFLADNGVRREDMLAEWQSTSTRENALDTLQMLNGMPGRKVLVTSDFHIFRAFRVFRKLGMDVTPMPVPDVVETRNHRYGRLAGFETMVEESTKIVYYELRGWI